jgi:hypothetical protein
MENRKDGIESRERNPNKAISIKSVEIGSKNAGIPHSSENKLLSRTIERTRYQSPLRATSIFE